MSNIYPVAPGVRGLGESGYIPVIYSPKLLVQLYASTFLPEISNTDYQGDIKNKGASVKIRKDPSITILDDVADGAQLPHETPQEDEVELLIDKSQAWAFKTGSVATKQTDIKNYRERWMAAANKHVKIRLETRVLQYLVTAPDALNAGASSGAVSGDIELGAALGTALAISRTNVVEYLANAEQVLDEQNVDKDGRWMIIPAWLQNRIRISDIADAAKMGDGTSIVRAPNGRLGMVNGFTLYVSNLLPTTTDSIAAPCTYIPFGHKQALTFAGQITENKQNPDPYGFSSLWHGLFVYGRKVVEPKALGVMVAKKG